MGKILVKIHKAVGKSFCFMFSAFFFLCVFGLIWIISFDFLGNDLFKGIFVVGFLFSLICGSLLLAAGLKGAEPEPPRFYTVDQDGKIVLTEISAPPLDCTETRRADGKVDISMQIHSKEQANEVLAALAIMYDKGDIADGDYHRIVRQIREWLEQ